MSLKIAGVDGCKAGWVIVFEEDGNLGMRLLPSLQELFRSEWDMVMIDIPIGLTEDGRRPCDLLARQQLGRKRASVFFAPTRNQLPALEYEEVRVQGVSLQTFYILPKIREVDQLISPTDQDWLKEAHPELAFDSRSEMDLGKKKSPEGRAARQRVLKAVGSPFRLGDWEKTFLRKAVALDDMLDAAILLEVARGWAQGEPRKVGEEQCDSRGLRMEICF
jgi:predicted RNase H-like nuclease